MNYESATQEIMKIFEDPFFHEKNIEIMLE